MAKILISRVSAEPTVADIFWTANHCVYALRWQIGLDGQETGLR